VKNGAFRSGTVKGIDFIDPYGKSKPMANERDSVCYGGTPAGAVLGWNFLVQQLIAQTR
jgi:hypothetical protein